MNIEKRAFGASICSKLKNNFIDTTEELQEAFCSGQIRFILNPRAIRSVRQVLSAAGIALPNQSEAAPAEANTNDAADTNIGRTGAAT